MAFFIPKIKQPQVSFRNAAIATVLVTEAYAFGFHDGGAWEFHESVGGSAVEGVAWVAKEPAQRIACHLTAILPKVNYDSNCVQNWDVFDSDPENATPAPTPAPTLAPEAPKLVPIAPEISQTDVNLLDVMAFAGYVCTNPDVVTAESGDSPIRLLKHAGTDPDVGQQANKAGAFGAIVINPGDRVAVGDCG